MIEFKFSCPNCGQHIKCDDSYSGRQIACPTCQKVIFVPSPPTGAPTRPTAPPILPPPTSVPPPPPTRPQAGVGPQPRVGMSAGKKSSSTKWMIIGSVGALLVAGMAVAAFLTGTFSRSSGESAPGTDLQSTKKIEAKKSRRGVKAAEPAPVELEGPTASEIVQKVTEKYSSLKSLTAVGRVITDLDLSGVNPKTLPGANANLPEDYKPSAKFKGAMTQPQHMEGDVTVKLSRPDLYRVEWDQQGGFTGNIKGAAWSSGAGNFGYVLGGPQKRYMQMPNREQALGFAAGTSGGAAMTVPELFFATASSMANVIEDAKRTPDETVFGEDCYVVNGTVMGMNVIVWVTKSNWLVKQRQIVMGGDANLSGDAQGKMQEAMKKFGGKMTQKQRQDMMNAVKMITSQIKGTITETYSKIETDKELAKEDFKVEVPAGLKLSHSRY